MAPFLIERLVYIDLEISPVQRFESAFVELCLNLIYFNSIFISSTPRAAPMAVVPRNRA
jgi:hypothetical protein